MASFMKEYEHLKIQLKEIKLATNDFHEKNVIGNGGFGKVYEGELCHSNSKKKSLVALKRLDRKHGQGDPQFWKEIMMLSRYRHQNLISLLGYCIEEGEMILIYEHASGGSLERYLNDVTLTWVQRIKICLDAAKGLSFLHEPNKRQQRVLHCDIKSPNILLDDDMNAKVSDFGLSKMGSTSQQHSVIITNAVGTPGYCDPLYMETYQLTKESDVYSFGVVLFEVLSGKLCVENINGQLKVYVPFWKKCYKEKKLDTIVFQGLMKQIHPDSLATFADIAYKCLERFREERPSMSLVVDKLQTSLALQELHDLKPPKEHEEIVNAAVPPLKYRSLDELKVFLTKGLYVNRDKTRWLSVNEKGEHFERIYIQACLNPDQIKATDYVSDEPLLKHLSDDIVNSRFPGGTCYDYYNELKAGVRGEYLTPHISYTLNLVFRYVDQSEVNSYNHLRYKIDGEDETKVLIIYPLTHMREDGWFVVPFYQLTSQHTTAHLLFEFEGSWMGSLVAGFEFQPFEEQVELQVFEEYQHIVEAASQSLFYTSLDELKQILRTGIHLKDYKTWFSLNKKGEHSHMISIEDCLIPNEDFTPRYESHFLSRFPTGFFDTEQKGFRIHVKTQLLNPLIPYTVNLVFSHSASHHQAYVDLKYRIYGETGTSTVYLANKRSDWLYMAELYQVTSNGGLVDLEIDFEKPRIDIIGVEGILFQPLEKVEDKLLEDDKVEDIQPILDSDTYWRKKMPHDYEEILKLSNQSVAGKTKKELYSMLCQGFLIDNGQQWFTVDKNGKKCQLLSARATFCAIYEKNSTWQSSNESRFVEVRVITAHKFSIVREIEPTMLSPDTTYACYLVYKLAKDRSTFESPLRVSEFKYGANYYYYAYSYLVSPPNTPVIGENLDENSYNPLNRHKLNALPRQRSDGWMEVKAWDFETKKTLKTVSMNLQLEHAVYKDLCGLIIQGIEIRPI